MADEEVGAASQRRRQPAGPDLQDSEVVQRADDAEGDQYGTLPGKPTGVISLAQSVKSMVKEEVSAGGSVLLRVLIITATICANATAILLTVPQNVLDDRSVDPSSCGGCNCWDGLSKAPYEKGGYKFIYWNMTWTTVLILAIMIFYIVLFERALEVVVRAVLSRRVELFTLLAFVACMPGNLYGAGTVYHYLNDRFYDMLPTQTFFSVTELLTIIGVWRCLEPVPADNAEEQGRREVYYWMCWVNSVCHIVLAGLDQIFLDLFWRTNVSRHGYARALIFSTTDTIVLLWASYHLGMFAAIRGAPSTSSGFNGRLRVAIAIVVAVCAWYRLALPLV